MRRFRDCLVIGHSGFLGGHFSRNFAIHHPDIPIICLSQDEIDLRQSASIDQLSSMMTPDTCVLMMAAVKRQLGDDPDAYQANIAMTVTLAKALARQAPARVIYLSSAAVYGEDIGNTAIDENTKPIPRSYYGLAKLAAEGLLTKALGDQAANRLVLLRPTTIYGADEAGTAYGPAGFLKRAMAAEAITLWGDGRELRDFVYVPDAVEVMRQLCFTDFAGPLNLVSGTNISFRDILEEIEALIGRPLTLTQRPRSKDKVDQGYDSGLLYRLLPNLKMTSVRTALAEMRHIIAR